MIDTPRASQLRHVAIIVFTLSESPRTRRTYRFRYMFQPRNGAQKFWCFDTNLNGRKSVKRTAMSPADKWFEARTYALLRSTFSLPFTSRRQNGFSQRCCPHQKHV